MISKHEMKTLQKEREVEISKILLQQPVDLVALREISRLKGGFLSSKLRTRVWPKLLGINRYDLEDYRKYVPAALKSPKRTGETSYASGLIDDLTDGDNKNEGIQDNQEMNHRDFHYVSCDVDRSLHNIYQIKFWSEAYRSTRRKVLSDIILAVLSKHSDRYYYQGFHDVVSVFFLVVEDDHLAFALTDVVSCTYFTDYMAKNFDDVSRFMQILMVLLKFTDSTLYNFLRAAQVEPYFAISWIITWFAHDVKSIDSIARIFDVMLSSHPMYCYYLCAAYLLCLKKDIMNCECDFSTLHNFLTRAPSKNGGLPFEKMVKIADELMLQYPLSRIVANSNSEIKSLVKQKRISLMSSTALMDDDFVDSDLTILENRKRKRASSYPVLEFYLKKVYSWSVRATTQLSGSRNRIFFVAVIAAASVAVSVVLILDEGTLKSRSCSINYFDMIRRSLQKAQI